MGAGGAKVATGCARCIELLRCAFELVPCNRVEAWCLLDATTEPGPKSSSVGLLVPLSAPQRCGRSCL